jgi:hypothetical protein
MANFMYLFRHNQAALRSMSPEQMQQLTKKWMGWAETLKKNGHFKQAGERLDGTGNVVRGKSKIVTDGPFVEAKDLNQAVELSKGCPILEGDGSVEIRPIVSM